MQLVRGGESKRPTFVNTDGPPVHRSACVRRFVEGTEGSPGPYVPPSYSPELNPGELVWNHVGGHQVGRKFVLAVSRLAGRWPVFGVWCEYASVRAR